MKKIIIILLGLFLFPMTGMSQNKETYLKSAYASFEKGEYDNAQKSLNIYVGVYHGVASGLANKIQQCKDFMNKAESAIARQQIKDAIDYYRGVLSINPNDPVAKKKIEDLETSAINDKTGTLVYATKTYDDGDKYVGYFLNNKKHGQGTYCWTDGDKYVGSFVNDRMQGQGTYYFNSGNRYEGEWKEGKKHGQGVFYWADGDKYEGSFVNDRMQGQGVFYWANGDKYEGSFVNGQRHGYGIYYNKSNNTITKQIWNNGIFEGNL